MTIVSTVHFHQLHIVKTGRIVLFLAAGFARVAIKELPLSGVPHRTPPVKRVLHILFHALILVQAFSPHQQLPSMVFRLVVKPIESS